MGPGVFVATVLIGLAVASTASAQTGANVAVVINENSPISIRIGEYYASKRAVPPSNIVRIKAPATESIARVDYVRHVEDPVGQALSRHSRQDQVLYIVLTKGVPLRIVGTVGSSGTSASVDSELTLLYRRLTGRVTAAGGPALNPYFLGEKSVSEAARFSRRAHDIYLVTRLDGFTVEDVIALIDRGLVPSPEGSVVLDQRAEPASAIGDRWMESAAGRVRAITPARPVILEETRKPAASTDPVLGYFSWGSTDAALTERAPGLTFTPGAIAAMLTSTDARTFEVPPAEWLPSNTGTERRTLFAGSSQSLVGDLIRAGVTGVAGNVLEPLLQSAVRPQVLFPAYLSGFNLAEAYYMALPHLSWQSVVIGDPLCRPFDGPPIAADDLDPTYDRATGLPDTFMSRRLEVLLSTVKGLPRDAAVHVLASQAARARDDLQTAISALNSAISIVPNLAQLQLDLAMLQEQVGDTPAAIALYRRVVDLEPRNVAALNNLAFALGTKEKALDEALGFARKAHALAPAAALVMDTVGWLEHLAGNKHEAVKLLVAAAQGAPDNAEIRLHAALALAAIAAYRDASQHLEAAIKLDDALETRAEVVQLRKQLVGR